MAKPYGFPRSARLLNAAAYQEAFASGRRFSGRNFTWVIAARLPTSTQLRPTARLGLAISKKNLSRAHERNRIKRLARTAFSQLRYRLPPLNLVLLCRASVSTASNAVLIAELNEQLTMIAQQSLSIKTKNNSHE